MKILVFSIHYPTINKNIKATSAVHYFTREWVKMGHDVVVVHNYLQLWKPLQFIIKKDVQKINYYKDVESYSIEGVDILFVPTTKFIPKSRVIFPSSIKKAKNSIITYLNKISFKPDIFIVDFCDEQWSIVQALRDNFQCTPVPVFNNCDIKIQKNVEKIISDSSKVGVRSRNIKYEIERICNRNIESFIINSGAPDNIYNYKKKHTNNGTKKLLFAGNLIPLKKVDITIKVLAKLKTSYDFVFNIVGSGIMEATLKILVKELELQDRVIFHGQKSRDEVIDLMRESDCFIMVSSPETFGIVYIEAMASGCYVIGSKGEGIDGILIDQYNGGLVPPDDIDMLYNEIKRYFELDSEKLIEILSNAEETANKLKESNVAKKYIEDILSD